MKQVWMQRVKVICKECECWKQLKGFADKGTCHRESAKLFGNYGHGEWPVTEADGFCFEGIQIEKELLNETNTGRKKK